MLPVNTGFMAISSASHLHMARRRQNELLPSISHTPLPSPDTTARSLPGPPPLIQMWQHSTTPLTRTKLPADPPKSFCLSYLHFVTKKQARGEAETDPITIQWWADSVYVVTIALSPLWSILTSAPPSLRTVAFDVIASLLPSPVSKHQLGAKAGDVLGLTSFINRPELSTKKVNAFCLHIFFLRKS